MRTMVYVDGFNLYYGLLKDSPYKWLNIQHMCQLLMPHDDIVGIRYFSAKVFSRESDPDKHIRQQVYWRALKTIPDLEIIEGHYSEHTKWMRLAHPKPPQNNFVEVIKTEEKGSDVNLAVHLLSDAYLKKYELGVVVSNDSDLLSAIQIVHNDLGLNIGILNPQNNPSSDLRKCSLFIKQIRTGVLNASQFPTTMTDSRGAFHKPKEW
jgi:uncharacterized LabA/DUF88 family protein